MKPGTGQQSLQLKLTSIKRFLIPITPHGPKPITGCGWSRFSAVGVENDKIINNNSTRINVLCTHTCKPTFAPPRIFSFSRNIFIRKEEIIPFLDACLYIQRSHKYYLRNPMPSNPPLLWDLWNEADLYRKENWTDSIACVNVECPQMSVGALWGVDKKEKLSLPHR